jgi:hypothetical protein
VRNRHHADCRVAAERYTLICDGPVKGVALRLDPVPGQWQGPGGLRGWQLNCDVYLAALVPCLAGLKVGEGEREFGGLCLGSQPPRLR